jgi:trehalose-6-phosphatase
MAMDIRKKTYRSEREHYLLEVTQAGDMLIIDLLADILEKRVERLQGLVFEERANNMLFNLRATARAERMLLSTLSLWGTSRTSSSQIAATTRELASFH